MHAEMDGLSSSKMALAGGAHSYALHGFNINASQCSTNQNYASVCLVVKVDMTRFIA